MPFRVAADVLTHLLPADVGMSPETLRAHTLKIGEQLGDIPTAKPVAAAMSITVTTDSTFIRSCEAGNRHLEVRVGNVETSDGGRQVFGAVARSNTDIAVQIRRSLEAVGGTAATKVTAFTDGCPGLRSILADAGVTTRPIADWFHIAMRLQHAKPAASGLLTDEPGRKEAKATIVTEVERLHWRIWNGKAKNAQKTFDRIRKVMHLYKGERGHRTRGVASRKLWHALHEIDKYLRSQSTRLVNYAARYRAGMRVGTAVTEGTANFLVNRRMNKSQQMRWSRRGANLVLQVRCAVYNGTLGSGFGQRFEPIGRPDVTVKIAAWSHQFLDTPDKADSIGHTKSASSVFQSICTRTPAIIPPARPGAQTPLPDGKLIPTLVADAGDQAVWRYIDYFTSHIRNPNTRRAYAWACQTFFAWCDERGLSLATIRPYDVATYIETRCQTHSAPDVKQQLAAVQMLFDWLVTSQVVPHNPAAAVRGPTHVVKTGKTRVLDARAIPSD
jgi:hypothetical protein